MAEEKEETKKATQKEPEKKAEESPRKDAVNLSDNSKKVMEIVEKMTVLELSELVKALEEKFGVSAAAPIMMATENGAAAEAAPEEEKSEYDVVLKSGGDQKLAVIKAVRELDQTLGLVDAKNLVEKGDAVILSKAKKIDAEEARKKLEAVGAAVELK